jgi:prevent-host-death family protein
MFHPDNITSLTDFQRNTAKYLKQLKKTKQPILLTVRGKAALVVSQPQATVAAPPPRIAQTPKQIAARIRLALADRGPGVPAEEVFAELRKKYLEPARKRSKVSVGRKAS